MGYVRPYTANDYDAVIALYQNGSSFGGQFDEARDSREKIAEVTTRDPESLLVYEENGEILGTVSLIENGRVAWLFRFAVTNIEQKDAIADALYKRATAILADRGHSQVLVYSDPTNDLLNERYRQLGMSQGGIYSCFWSQIR